MPSWQGHEANITRPFIIFSHVFLARDRADLRLVQSSLKDSYEI